MIAFSRLYYYYVMKRYYEEGLADERDEVRRPNESNEVRRPNNERIDYEEYISEKVYRLDEGTTTPLLSGQNQQYFRARLRND